MRQLLLTILLVYGCGQAKGDDASSSCSAASAEDTARKEYNILMSVKKDVALNEVLPEAREIFLAGTCEPFDNAGTPETNCHITNEFYFFSLYYDANNVVTGVTLEQK